MKAIHNVTIFFHFVLFFYLAVEKQIAMRFLLIWSDYLVEVAKWAAICASAFILLAELLIKSDDVHVDNDPTHQPPII